VRPHRSSRLVECCAAIAVFWLVALGSSRVATAESLSRHVFAAAEGGVVLLGGELRDYTSNGVRLGLRQGMQFGLVGFSLGIASDAFLTSQPPPTRLQGLRLLHLSLGPRVSHSTGPVRWLGGFDYQRTSALQNPLADVLGPEVNRNGVAIWAAARFETSTLLYGEASIRSEWSFSRRGSAQATVLLLHVEFFSPF
jgi:hypothetical protein